jgi:ribosomal protein S18 acetylase RimI-like enzyme
MSPLSQGAKPAVLRCSRCGRFVDWEDARLQIVCSCRTYVKLPPVIVREGEEKDQSAIVELFERDFGSTSIVAFGEDVVVVGAPALVAWMKGELAGALVYRLLPDALLMLALVTDPMWQRSGVGGHLVAEAEALARAKGLRRVLVSTTNDNLPALYFYQRREYHITEVVPGGMLSHVKTPDSKGFGGIPLRDEIRMERVLTLP